VLSQYTLLNDVEQNVLLKKIEIAVKLKCDVNLVFMMNIYMHYTCTCL